MKRNVQRTAGRGGSIRGTIGKVRSLLVMAALLVAGCAAVPPGERPIPSAPVVERGVRYHAVAWAALPGWREDRVEDAWPAYLVGCKALERKTATGPAWRDVCAAARAIDPGRPGAVRGYFESHFIAYEVSAGDVSSGLITGYYEPILEGSREPSARFRVPLYAVPDDLVVVDLASLHPELRGKRVRGRLDGRRVVPYWSRADLANGRTPAARALVYVEDTLDAFFLEIQGSGRVSLPDGTLLRLGYADQNGHPYKAIGRVLAERGAIPLEQISLQAIQKWARAHPEAVPELLAHNPSYVFFREVAPPPPGSLEAMIDGPLGALGVPLAAGRTVAVDPDAIPLGAPVYLASRDPVSGAPLERLVMAEDTGGAIRGAVRADLFWGRGDSAGQSAGRMKEPGRLWMLWPAAAPMP